VTGALIGIALVVLMAAFLLWTVWPARTGAIARGERGNDGLIPGAGDPDSGPGNAIGD
jgi:hypothetical protein